MSRRCGRGSNFPFAGCSRWRLKDALPKLERKGYDANVAIMDLIAMHGNIVVVPLNISPHNSLVLLKEAAGLTIIPSPTVEHSMTNLLNKIKSTSPPMDRGQKDGSSTTTDAAHTAQRQLSLSLLNS